MSELQSGPRIFQWKWVWISMALYAILYALPLVLFARSGSVIAAMWVFAGIMVVAAIAGYLSEGVTIWEPAIAGAGTVLLLLIAILISVPPRGNVEYIIFPMAMTLVLVFLLSLLGAWFGERVQKVWKKRAPEGSPDVPEGQN